MKEKLLKEIIRTIVKEVYNDVTSRDVDNITDAVYCEEVSYLRDLKLYIESNKID